MDIVSRSVSYKAFRALFDEFAESVKTKTYRSIPYQRYKSFQRALNGMNPTEDVYIDYQGDIDAMIVFTDDGGYDFPAGDGSFGEFLFYKLDIDYDLLHSGYYDSFNKYPVEQAISSACYPVKNYKLDIAASESAVNSIKEDNKMKFNFDFGPVNSSTVRMSMYGLAVKNKTGTWVSYDAASGNIVDVDVFNFDGAKFLYKMPVAIKDIAVGDVVIHNGVPMFVLATGMKTLTVVDVVSGERKDIMLATSPFGFNFATKVVNFLGNVMTSATAENPFGNMWMLMALSGDNKDMGDMLPFMMMANGTMDMSNPMMLWALAGNRTNDPMMLMAMMGAFNKPASVCACGGNCGDTQSK